MKLKLNDQGYDILKDELSKNEGTFSKTTNVMLAFDLMENEEELTSTQVTKAHLANIIKILCNKLKWIEEPEDLQNCENEVKTDAKRDIKKTDEENHSNVKHEEKNSEKVCKFYKTGKCKYGRSGRNKDQNGKSCDFMHPQTCKKFELFGYKEGGCKDKKCNKLHMTLCKIFMRHQECKFGDTCKYYHPKKLRNQRQSSNFIFSETVKEGNLTYAQAAKSTFQPKSQSSEQSPFLGQNQIIQQPIIGLTNQFQQPIKEQGNHTQKIFLELQNGQKHMLQLFMDLNQKIMNLEKCNPLLQSI